MSWGVDIEISHDDGYATVVEVVDGHTYNLTPMWRKAGVVLTCLCLKHPKGVLRWNG